MAMMMNETRIVLDGIPCQVYDASVNHLAELLDGCQQVLASHEQGAEVDPELLDLVTHFVPDLEEVQQIFAAGQVTPVGDTCRVEVELQVGHDGAMAHLQMQLVQLRLLGRRAADLPQSDPELMRFLKWAWDEFSDQLHGRAARPYGSRAM